MRQPYISACIVGPLRQACHIPPTVSTAGRIFNQWPRRLLSGAAGRR